ncbi:MAG: hypothetical protein KA226_07475 [Gemmatimonadales bacterium]|nr:hypothetical protein [Gemmatimonadales bacterium]MBP7619998.1 hypothetical protein [Gemmatimonadales bacterium]
MVALTVSARRGGVALKMLAGVAMLAVVGVVVFNQFILPTLKPTAFVIGSTTGYRVGSGRADSVTQARWDKLGRRVGPDEPVIRVVAFLPTGCAECATLEAAIDTVRRQLPDIVTSNAIIAGNPDHPAESAEAQLQGIGVGPVVFVNGRRLATVPTTASLKQAVSEELVGRATR